MKRFILISLLIMPSLLFSQKIEKEVTTIDGLKLVIITIGDWKHYYNNDTLVGSWFENDTIKYNYSKEGRLQYKEVTEADTTYHAKPISYAWSVEWTKIRYEVVDIEEVIEIIEPINLFDPNDSDVSIGYYVNCNLGILNSNYNYNASGFMPISGGKEYSLSYKHQIAWYDEDKTYISGSNSSDSNKVQLAPDNAAYLRCTIILSEFDTFTVTEVKD